MGRCRTASPGAAGIGMAGGFGTGKSHLLGYLAEVARQQGFVVSRVVVSKETPLSHPGHVLAAALRDAVLPDRPDAPIAACVAALRERPEALDAMEIAVSTPDAGFAPIFAACLFLIRRASTPPEMLRRIATPVGRREGEHPGHPPGACRGRGGQDVFTQADSRRRIDRLSSPGSCRCCSVPPAMPAGASCSTRSN